MFRRCAITPAGESFALDVSVYFGYNGRSDSKRFRYEIFGESTMKYVVSVVSFVFFLAFTAGVSVCDDATVPLPHEQTVTVKDAVVPAVNGMWDLTLEETMQMALKNNTQPLGAKLAYWNLYSAYHRLESMRSSRNVAHQTWQQTKTYKEVGDRRGSAQNLAQAEQNYFLFRQQTELAQNNLFKAEATLRYILGITSTDGRLIRPIKNPTSGKDDI